MSFDGTGGDVVGRRELESALGARAHFLTHPNRPELTRELLSRLVPDVANVVVFVCGPLRFMQCALDACRGLKVKTESFTF